MFQQRIDSEPMNPPVCCLNSAFSAQIHELFPYAQPSTIKWMLNLLLTAKLIRGSLVRRLTHAFHHICVLFQQYSLRCHRWRHLKRWKTSFQYHGLLTVWTFPPSSRSLRVKLISLFTVLFLAFPHYFFPLLSNYERSQVTNNYNYHFPQLGYGPAFWTLDIYLRSSKCKW